MKKILGLMVVLNTLVMPIYATGSFSDNLTVPHTLSFGKTGQAIAERA